MTDNLAPAPTFCPCGNYLGTHPFPGCDPTPAGILNRAADAIDAETQMLKDDGVLEPEKFRPCRDASEQLREMADRCPTTDKPQTKADILTEAADWLTAKYGVTNRAAGDLRRMAKGEI